MQNIQKLYQDLHEGKISKNQFLFQIRKDSRINSFFTSANSYDETIRILKNRGLLFEVKINESIEEEIGSNDPETSHEGLNNITEAKNNPKVEKLVNVINDMISKAIDEDGDPIGVIEPGTTWEEPYTYSPIEYKNGTLIITSKSQYKNTPEVDKISSENMMYDGIPTLQLIARMYKKALKKAGSNQEIPPAPSQEETDANQVYENDLNEAKEPAKGADQVNPYELEKGTYYELDCQKEGAKDTNKAKAKALKNLNKNPKYYSDLFSKQYNDKPNTSDKMQIVKESLKNLIDDILSEE